MKYKLDEMISINNKEWRVAEYRMGRGREWVYTLSHETTDGSYTTMSLNERAMNQITLNGEFIGSNEDA